MSKLKKALEGILKIATLEEDLKMERVDKEKLLDS
jgi:hypothetical protein